MSILQLLPHRSLTYIPTDLRYTDVNKYNMIENVVVRFAIPRLQVRYSHFSQEAVLMTDLFMFGQNMIEQYEHYISIPPDPASSSYYISVVSLSLRVMPDNIPLSCHT